MPESKKKLTPQQMEDKIDEVWFEDRPTTLIIHGFAYRDEFATRQEWNEYVDKVEARLHFVLTGQGHRHHDAYSETL